MEQEKKIRRIIADILDVKEEKITETFGPNDAAMWDSLNNLQLITALEEEKSRIDQIIRDIQGVIPHYEALIAAERALDRGVKATDGVPAAS